MDGRISPTSMKLLDIALQARVRNTVLLCLLAIFTFLVLISYKPLDPSWLFAANNVAIRNLLGGVGATVADLLVQTFGYVAFLIPVLIVAKVGGVLIDSNPLKWWHGTLAGCGFLVILGGFCVLCGLWSGGYLDDVHATSGYLGQYLIQFTYGLLGTYVSVLVALAGVFVGLWLLLRFRISPVLEYVGVGVLGVLRFMIWPVRHLIKPNSDEEAQQQRLKPSMREATVTSKNQAKRKRKPLRSRGKKKERVQPTVGADSSSTPQTRTRRSVSPNLRRSAETSEFPSVKLLQEQRQELVSSRAAESINRIAEQLGSKLADFGVEAEVVSVMTGPVVTRFEIQPAPGIKVSKISALVKDLARSLAVVSVRVVEVIPGKSVVGIEIPNDDRAIVFLRQVLESGGSTRFRTPLSLALGRDVAGNPVFVDIEKMPHLLVAGTTGSGKSVCLNGMLVSLLLNVTPEQVRLILIDPKMLELAVYENIPHLLTPVVTDMQEAAHSLNWCIAEMERRYQLMASLNVRNIAGFNSKIEEADARSETIPDPLRPFDMLDESMALTKLPLIVVIVDEFADMMMIVGKKVEQLIARLAQKARAAGIHLILATQRPSVDVITGLIKANIPARISFQVSSQIDSRTILDQGGAEQLLGHGDMLYLAPGSGVPIRVHGAFVSDSDVLSIADSWRARQAPDYRTEITQGTVEPTAGSVFSTDNIDDTDELYEAAVSFVVEKQRVSISSIQRRFRIGYNRAARIVECMEEAGITTAPDESGNRSVLVNAA